MKIERRRIEDLQLDPDNAREHDDANLEAIKSSLGKFGQRKPIVVADGVVIAGNGTMLAAQALGWKEIDTVSADDLDELERKAYAIADNRTAELAKWNQEKLAQALADITEIGDELGEASGFDHEAIVDLVSQELGDSGEPAEIVEDEVPEVEDETVTQPGDLWVLGEHRLLCGDSTKQEDVERLMDGDISDLLFTSPPYALGSSVTLSGNRAMSKRGNAYQGHEDDPDKWMDLMSGWWSSFEGISECYVVNVQLLAGNKRKLMQWIADRSDRIVDVAIWNKISGAPQMASGVLTSIFEFLLVFGGRGASKRIPFSSWHGTVKNIYNGPPQRSNEFAEQHAATMPLHLVEWILGTLCDQAKTVVDPFAGTGTTAIVAEQMGRRSFSLEIHPAYCDVIVRRWQKLTGQRAVNEATGELFPE